MFLKKISMFRGQSERSRRGGLSSQASVARLEDGSGGSGVVSSNVATSSSSDSSLGYFNSILESGQLGNYVQKAVLNGEEEALEKTLQQYAQEKHMEIQELCEKNYRVFLDSVEEVLTVKHQAGLLKSNVIKLQDGVNEAGGELREAVEQLLALRRAKANVQKAREAIAACAEVVQQCRRIQNYLQVQKYAAALRLMQELEEGDLLRQIAQYEYGEYVAQRLPVLKQRIRRDVTAQFSAWLLLARDAATRVGRAALVCAADEQKSAVDDLMAGLDGWTAPRREGRVLTSYRELVESAGRCQLAPPHSCLYIYSRLGLEEDFKKLYVEARRTQARATALGDFDLLDMLCSAMGFFVIEDAVGLRLLDDSQLHALWDGAMLNVTSAMPLKLSSATPEYKERLAQQVMLAMKVARALYLPLDRLQVAAQLLARQYLLGRANDYRVLLLRTLVDAAHFAPLVLDSSKDWDRLVCSHKLDQLMGASFVKGQPMPFTEGVPLALDALKEYIAQSESWLAEIGNSEVEIRETVSESVTQLLNSLYRDLVQQVCAGDGNNESNAAIGGLVQLLINVQFMTMAVGRWGEEGDMQVQLAEGPQKELFQTSQNTFLQLLTSKLKQLIPAGATGVITSLIDDVLPYLDAVLPTGEHYPLEVLQPLRLAAVRAVCEALKGTFSDGALMPPQVKMLARDIKTLATWARQDDGSLQQMAQLADLLMAKEKMSDFLNDEKRRAIWPLLGDGPVDPWRIPNAELCKWLLRVKEDGLSFFGQTKQDKNAESLAKKLKQ